MKRDDVFQILDLERNYQDARWQAENDPGKSVSEWIIYMERHLEEAKRQIYMLNYDGGLEQVRKVTALGIACMEYNDTKPREVEEDESSDRDTGQSSGS